MLEYLYYDINSANLTCFPSCSRKRRDAVTHSFKAEDIFIVEIRPVPNSEETEVEFFVLDPSVSSGLPVMAFSSADLKSLMLKIESNELPYPLKSVDGVKSKDSSSTEDGGSSSKSTIPIAVTVAAVIVLVIFIVFFWLYVRRRKSKRCVFKLRKYNVCKEY